jgi:hypothetical protein
VKIDGQPGSSGEVIQDEFEVGDRSMVGPTDDESVINILENGTRQVRREGVANQAVPPSFTDEALKDVRHDDEEVWRKRVTLPKPIAATNPVPRDPIEEDRSVSGGKNAGHPLAPAFVEAPSFENGQEAVPVNGIESFSEVDFEDDGGGFF